MRLSTNQFESVRWWELAGHDPGALREAWRQTHYAAQAVAEVGKSWGTPAPDDSHTNLSWFDGSGLLEGAMLGQVAGAGSEPVRAALRLQNLRLLLLSPAGAPLAQTSAAGRTVEETIAWMRAAAATKAGDAARQADPAPDLPEHPLGAGGRFDEPAQLAQAELIRLYANASAMLERIATLASPNAEPVRIWPHHFDVATLITVARAEDGAQRRTLGIGLTPPDALIDEGYWYVSGWSVDPPERSGGAMAPLPVGRWIDRPGALPMAALPLSEITAHPEDPEAFADRRTQKGRVAEFLGGAANSTLEALGDA